MFKCSSFDKEIFLSQCLSTLFATLANLIWTIFFLLFFKQTTCILMLFFLKWPSKL